LQVKKGLQPSEFSAATPSNRLQIAGESYRLKDKRRAGIMARPQTAKTNTKEGEKV
jgi:hypothetical protein